MAMWHNGKFKETAMIDASSAGLLLGWGVFSTVAIRDGRALWPEKHLTRLRRDAAKCEIEISFSDEELRSGLSAVLRENDVQNGLARLTAARSDDGRWNTQTGSDVTIAAIETAPAKTRELRVGFANAPDSGELHGVKTTSYLPYFWSWKRAISLGLDEMILFDAQNRVVEAARSSVFWVREEKLETAPLSLGALEGVGREIVFEWAKSNDVEAREEELDVEQLRDCSEVFLVSAAMGPRLICTLVGSQEHHLKGELKVFEKLRAWWDVQ